MHTILLGNGAILSSSYAMTVMISGPLLAINTVITADVAIEGPCWVPPHWGIHN